MDLDDQLHRYFGTSDPSETPPRALEAALERMRIDFGHFAMEQVVTAEKLRQEQLEIVGEKWWAKRRPVTAFAIVALASLGYVQWHHGQTNPDPYAQCEISSGLDYDVQCRTGVAASRLQES